jgi:hypothetical protein
VSVAIMCLTELDLQVDNDADNVMRLIAKTIGQVPPSTNKPWTERINLGCWTVRTPAPAIFHLKLEVGRKWLIL